MGWLNVFEAHQAQRLELPVTLRFCFEGTEESGSEGLDELIEKGVAEGECQWFKSVECVCIVCRLSSHFLLPVWFDDVSKWDNCFRNVSEASKLTHRRPLCLYYVVSSVISIRSLASNSANMVDDSRPSSVFGSASTQSTSASYQTSVSGPVRT